MAQSARALSWHPVDEFSVRRSRSKSALLMAFWSVVLESQLDDLGRLSGSFCGDVLECQSWLNDLSNLSGLSHDKVSGLYPMFRMRLSNIVALSLLREI